ncbi:MAG: hypothetical protein ACREH5_00670 [Candidatus Omnitrophota bacterium]
MKTPGTHRQKDIARVLRERKNLQRDKLAVQKKKANVNPKI